MYPPGESPATRRTEGNFGSYTIVRQLGAGAFGAVYEARKEPIGKRIALKLLHRDKAQSPTINARFVQEAQAAASLRHPHIVDVDDVGVIDGVPFIAMEFLEGQELSGWMKQRGPLGAGEMLEVMLPIFSAVAAVHGRGIVHRDLKPDNIFLWRPLAGQVHPKLLDFGIAKVREGYDGAGLTQSGAIMGTPRYMSPEQWGGSKHASAQSDQWALGVIVFQCLTGRLPFEADELPALMMRISTLPPLTLRALVPSIPEALERAVLRALEKDPGARHGSVREFARELLPFANPVTRARWSAEFGEEATLSSEVAQERRMVPPTLVALVPDTLDSSTQKVSQASRVRSHRGRLAALVAGVVAIASGVYAVGAWRTTSTTPDASLQAAVGPTPSPPATRVAAAPTSPAVAPSASGALAVSGPAAFADAGSIATASVVDASRPHRTPRRNGCRPLRNGAYDCSPRRSR